MCVVTFILNTVKVSRDFTEKNYPRDRRASCWEHSYTNVPQSWQKAQQCASKHCLRCLKLLLHSSPCCSEMRLYRGGNLRCQNRVETVNSVGTWVKKKNFLWYCSLIGIVFVNLVTLIHVLVNYAITFTCLEANLQFLLRLFLKMCCYTLKSSAKILTINWILRGLEFLIWLYCMLECEEVVHAILLIQDARLNFPQKFHILPADFTSEKVPLLLSVSKIMI